MNTVDLITKKRDGNELSYEEIKELVMGYTEGRIPDYQMSAFLMAVYFSGLNVRETAAITDIMKNSGDIVDLSGIAGVKVDKHSTGGVGDKTTLIVGPIAAACGVPVAKMSGRGLGFTGGTVDKLESIPGFEVAIEHERFMKQVNDIGIAVISQTGHIAPADKKMYALRDVTGTVENLGLITSSVMSKKLASGSNAILLDVKCGRGAFMKNIDDAERLASRMVEIGKADGKKTMAVITDMEQPLGNAVGNSLEVMEAIEVLKGNGPADITELSMKLAGMMIYMGEKADSPETGEKMAANAVRTGGALAKLRAMIEVQGGDPNVTEDMSLLPQSGEKLELRAETAGYIVSEDAMKIGLASQHTGAGRERKEDDVDLSAGLRLSKKTGDRVERGDLLCTLYGNDMSRLESAREEAALAISIGPEKPEKRPLIKKIVK